MRTLTDTTLGPKSAGVTAELGGSHSPIARFSAAQVVLLAAPPLQTRARQPQGSHSYLDRGPLYMVSSPNLRSQSSLRIKYGFPLVLTGLGGPY